jgi:hypothetical protein
MDSIKEFKRATLPFDTPIPIPKNTKELLVNSFGYIGAEINDGVLKVQTKKHKNGERELVVINTNATPPTIAFTLEKKKP